MFHAEGTTPTATDFLTRRPQGSGGSGKHELADGEWAGLTAGVAAHGRPGSLAFPAFAVILIVASTVSAAWPVSADPTGRYLVDQEGKPFFWLGDTAWMLCQAPNREDAEHYLATRARQGFTVVQAAAVMGEERVAGTALPNAYGDTAFVDNDPARPRTTAGANPAASEEYDYWDHVDYVIGRAEAHGLTVGLLPLFVGWRGDGYKYLKTSNAYAYGRFLGERYRDRPNIVWLLGGDNVADTEEKRAIWNAVAKAITVPSPARRITPGR